MVLDRLNRRVEALAAFDQALAQAPHCADTRYNRSLACLALGRLEEGFREMESRWDTTWPGMKRPRFEAAPWRGDASLEGKTILLHDEQGLGDTLQFVRYVPMVARRGASVLLSVPGALRSLMGCLEGDIHLLAEGEPSPSADYCCSLMSLPLAFGTALDSIPASIPYLRADLRRVEQWSLLLGARTRPRIGVVWAGRQYKPVNTRRDMPLRSLRPLLQLDADWISLQKEIPEGDRAWLGGLPRLQRHGETVRDFADTAALIENLDLVITVDSAVAHLAGALGKPVWIMNRYAACWRWMEQRSDSPWYPTARLFRQPSLGEWDAVVDEVLDEATAFIGRASAGAPASS